MGFLLLVLYPPPPPPRPSSSSSLTSPHLTSLSHSLTHSVTHSLTHSLTDTHSLARSLTHSLARSLTHSLTHSRHSLTSFTHLYSPTSCALPRGRMYALGFGWRLWVSASFAWQAWDHVHCQGVGCTPWGSAGVPGSPPLLRGRRGWMCIAKGSDVRPGVRLASLGLRLFCVAAVGQCALPRGRMYALGFGWRPWVSASFVWQVWDNVHCQGVGCTPWGFAWRPWVSASFAWQPWDNVHCQGVWRPWVSASFVWQACHNVHFCVAGVGQCALPRGQCALLVAFVWQAWDTVLTLFHTHSLSLISSLTHSLNHSCTHSLTDSLDITLLRDTHTHIFILRVCSCILTAALFISWSIPSVGQRLGDCCTTLAFCLLHCWECVFSCWWRWCMYAEVTICAAVDRIGVLVLRLLRSWCWSMPLHTYIAHTHTRTYTHSHIHHTHTSFAYIHKHKLTHHRLSITIILPLPLLTYSLPPSLTHSHHSLTFWFTHLCMRIHTHIHKNSPTITPPSLLYFLFPSCFSMLSLSLEKLVTCGVIRSYNFRKYRFLWILPWSFHGIWVKQGSIVWRKPHTGSSENMVPMVCHIFPIEMSLIFTMDIPYSLCPRSYNLILQPI